MHGDDRRLVDPQLEQAAAAQHLDVDTEAIFARGGYGCARIVERLDFSPLRKHPKLFLGYSDLTAFYSALDLATGLPGFYGPMALNFNSPGREFREKSLWDVMERRPGWNRPEAA